MKKILTIIYFLLFFCVVLCAQKNNKKIIFSPQWMPQAQFAGYYIAKEKGFYDEVGLDVEMVHSSGFSSSLTKLQKGESDIISAQLLQSIIAKDNGQDIVNIAQTSQVNGLVIVAQPQYKSLEELVGRRVAVWNSGFSELVYCMAKDNGYDIEWVKIPSGINYFVSQAVDGILTMYYNEYFLAMNCGRKVTEKNVFHISEYGYNIPEDGLYCTKSNYLKNEKEFILFVEASRKGWEYARANPDEAIEIVIKIMKENNIASSISHQKWMLEKILELQINKDTKTAVFTLDPKIYKYANDVLKKNGLVKRDIPYNQFVAPKYDEK
jgi:NitT/TauT family transport system substrate-binding protein